MEEARTVLERLTRVEELERDGVPPELLLDEVRVLLRAAEAWAQRERDGSNRVEAALARCRAALADGRVGPPIR